MPKIYRFNQLILSDEVYTIPDDEPIPTQKMSPKKESSGEEFEELQEWEPDSFREIMDHFEDSEEFSESLGESQALAKELLQKAKEEAALIVNQANLQAKLDHDRLLAQTTLELEEIKKQAYAEAYQAGQADGAREQRESILACIRSLEESVGRLEGEQAGFMAEYEYNLKWLAWEVASKVLAHKIEEDETEMITLVKTAVASVKNAKWIAVEVSEKMTTLIDQLTKEFKNAGEGHIEVRGVSAPDGTCIVDTQEGLLDASVYSQLENLRLYFAAEENQG